MKAGGIGGGLACADGPDRAVQFLEIADLEALNRALVFELPDCYVRGRCELYTTKVRLGSSGWTAAAGLTVQAAGLDKKLYRTLDRQLEARYLEDVAVLQRTVCTPSPPRSPPPTPGRAASAGVAAATVPIAAATNKRARSHLAPPRTTRSSCSLPSTSPFGPLDMAASRKAFTYLIATLNASHPDHDFSTILHPSDFHREKSPGAIFFTLRTYLYPASPPVSSQHNGAGQMGDAISSLALLETVLENEMGTGAGSGSGNVDIWVMGDEEVRARLMSDVFPRGTIWTAVYFIFSKKLKRVAYLRFWGVGRQAMYKRVRSEGWDDESVADTQSFIGADDWTDSKDDAKQIDGDEELFGVDM